MSKVWTIVTASLLASLVGAWATGSQVPVPTEFCQAILTKESIELRGGVVVDSFDSGNPAYSTNGRYDPAKRRDGGNLGSVADTFTEITETGTARVYGRAATGPLGSVSLSGNAALGSLAWIDGGNSGIQPGWYTKDLVAELPDPQLPDLNFEWLTQESGTVGGTNYNYVLRTGNYKTWQDFTLSSSRKMAIDGDVVIYFKQDFDITGSALVYLTPGSTLTVYLGGSAKLTGRGLVNGNGLASMCRLYGLSTCSTIEYAGSSSFVGTIYAPRAYVKLSGGGSSSLSFVGAVVAKSAKLTGTYAFHFDESLCNTGNRKPVANDDSYRVLAGEPLVAAAPGLLGNDSDPDGDPLTATRVDGPANGSLSLNDSGAFTYTPAPGFVGGDQFTYRAFDGRTNSNLATVRITVTLPFDYCVTAAEIDPQYGHGNATHAVYLPGIANDFVFVPEPGSLIESSDGTLRLTGTARSASAPAKGFLVDVVFSQYSATPPPGSPKKELDDGAYVENGGSIDAGTWAYYQTFGGTLTGIDALAGARLNITRVGPSFQIGGGANGKNLNFGASSWFTWSTASQPTVGSVPATGQGDFNVNLGHCIEARDDSYSTRREEVLNVAAPGVLANDVSSGSDPLRASLVNSPAHGSITLRADGSFTYSPNAGFVGTDLFTYVAEDDTLSSNLATVRITVTEGNAPPVANPDGYSTAEDTVLTVNAPGVLANDTDPEGGPLTASLSTPPQHGTLTLNPNGSFVYAPVSNYNGTDSFTYRAGDGFQSSAPATVTITVTPVNDPPIAQADNYATAEDVPLNVPAPGVLVNDSDPDGDPLTAVLVNSPSSGSVTLNPNGSFGYIPASGFSGTDTFSYRANDGTAASQPVTVTIVVTPVPDAPKANPDNYSTLEDVTLIVPAPGVLGNDTDEDGDPLTATIVSPPQQGSVTLNANGSFTYVPPAGYNGTVTFSYRANDATSGSAPAVVTIVVTPVADAPVASPDNYSTAEDVPLNVSPPGVLANDTDQDGDSLSAALAGQPQHGSLTLSANGSFVYTPAADFIGTDSFTYRASDGALFSNPTTVTIVVTPVNDAPAALPDNYSTAEDVTLVVGAPGILANDSDVDGDVLTAVVSNQPLHGSLSLQPSGSFSYVPNGGYHGTDTFSYRASDGTGFSPVVVVTIVVTPVADAPVAKADTYTTAEDVTLTVPAPGVLANDTDEDGDPLTAILADQPQHGDVTLNANGSFSYIPTPGFNGVDGFSYRANDGTSSSAPAFVTVVVTPVPDAPVANPDNFVTTENVTLVVSAPGVLGNDTDQDGDSLTAAIVGQPLRGSVTLNANGSFTYSPESGFRGTDSFTYRANDGAASSAPALVTILVTAVGTGPIARPDSFTTPEDTILAIAAPGVLVNDSLGNGGALTAVLVSQPPHGSVVLNGNGAFTYVPAKGYFGFDSFVYLVSDGATVSAPTLVSIDVTPVADAPVARPDQFVTAEDTTLAIAAPGVLLNDSDEDGDPLTAVLESPPTNGTLSLNANGAFSYAPTAGFNGVDTFTYRASDGASSSAPAIVTIQVTPVSDAPVALPDNYSTLEDVALVVAAPGVLANDSDPDGDALTAFLGVPPLHGDVSLNPDGSFTYTPSAGYHGTDSFTYRAFDGAAVSGPTLVTITITPVDDQLIARPDRYTTPEDVVLNVPAPGVLANDSNEDGGPLRAVLEGLPAHGTVTLFIDGRFSYRPNTNYHGPDSFTYRAVDGAVSSAPVLVSIEVTPVADVPVAVADFYLTPFNTPLIVGPPGVLANDSDPEGDPLTAQLVSPPAHGTLSLSLNGSFTYTPEAGFIGQDSFIYLARDEFGATSAATASIAVGVPNSDPDTLADSYGAVEDFPLEIGAPGVLLNDATAFGLNLLTTLVGSPRHGAISLSADGSFTYIPAADFFGNDSIQYRASDGVVSLGPVTVEINVLPVNDAPSFTKGPDQLVQLNAGAVTVPAWATNISPGPANESDQSVGFIVSSDNPSLFAAPPAVSAEGTLTFTPAQGAYGLAVVSVTARDSGGTDLGGVNSSAPTTFTIRVNSPPLVQVISPDNGNTYFPHQPIPFTATATDPDGTVVGATLMIDGAAVATFPLPPYHRVVSNLTAAAHTLTASARDDLGATGLSSPVGLTVIPRPPVTPLRQGFNFQVGLVEQVVRVDNPTPYPITAARVLVSGLPPNVRVFNASGTNQTGVPFVQYNREVPARSSVLLTIEYLTPLVQTIQSTLTGEIVPIAPPPAPAAGELIQIKRMSKFPDGRVLLTFDSIIGRVYSIEYSEDLELWKTSYPGIKAVGTGIQWVDNGWPKTMGHPADFPERFYRVRLTPAATP